MFCIPADTDWSCAYSVEELEEMRQDDVKSAAMLRSETLAWYTLAALCAYQIGVCPETIRPCAARCGSAGTWAVAPVTSAAYAALPLRTIGGVFTPHITGGQWVNSCRCASASACDCSFVSEVYLPGPVGAIESVIINGQERDPSTYRIDNGDRLVSLDPDAPWPLCSDPLAGPEDENSFLVTYYRGAAPNELTKFAAGMLAVEFYKACTGGKCRLPAGVTQITRQGVTMEVQTGMFPGGFTGIREVDAVIRIYNPYGLKKPPRVLSPDSPSERRRYTTWSA